MALFQPTNVSPSTFTNTGTVDATEDLEVTWQVNGNSPMVAYQIQIMQNDTDSTEVYDSNKITLQTPFYGVDYKGNVKFFSTKITSSQLSTAGIVNGYENGYKLLITQWWGNTDAQSVRQSSASYFITRAKPTVTMGTIPTQFTFIKYTFSATYSQAQGDAIEWMQWEIEWDCGAFEKVYDTGKIYGTADLKTTYDCFFPTSTYRIKCTVQTENGVQADTGWVTFQTWYNIGFDNAHMVACPLCDRDAVMVGVPKNAYVLGNATGTYSFSGSSNNYSITLPADTKIQWSGGVGVTLDISTKCTYIVGGNAMSVTQNPDNPLMEIIGASGETGIYADTKGIFIKRNDDVLYRTNSSSYSGGNFAVAISNAHVEICYITAGASRTETANIPAWQKDREDAIAIYGGNSFKLIWAFIGDQTEYANRLFNGTLGTPAYDELTQFIYAPGGTLLSGGNLANVQNFSRFTVFRNRTERTEFTRVAEYPIGFTNIFDYGAASQIEYQYVCYPLYTTEISDFNIYPYYRSMNVNPLFWNYTVLTAYKDSENYYHVLSEYRFALDVASGAVGNNNTPSLWQNFTQYPTMQKTSSNYKSGTLSAFIGKVVDGEYVGDIDLMNELYALSTDGLTKFLKTRKGDFMMIETSAPIIQQIGDKFAAQPAKISLPWVETGSAEGVSVIGNAMLSDAPFFYVDLVEGEAIMLYFPEYVDSGAFTIVDGDLYLNDPGIYDESAYSLGTNKNVMLEV